MASKNFLSEDEVLDLSQLETPKPDGKVVVNTMFLPNDEAIDYTSAVAPDIPRYTKVYGDTIGPDLEQNFIAGEARRQMWEEGFQKNIADAFKHIDTFGGVPEGFDKLNFKAQCQMLANIYAQRAAETDNASEKKILDDWATTLMNYANGIRNTYQERLNAVNLHYGTPLGAGPDEDGGANPNNRYSGAEPQKYVLPELEGVSRDSAFRIPFKDSWGTKALGERVKTAQRNALDHNVVPELGGGLLGLPFLKEAYDRGAVGMDYKDLDANGQAKQIAVPILRTSVLGVAPWLSPLKAAAVGALDAPLVGMFGNDPAAQWNPDDEFYKTPTGEKIANSAVGAGASAAGSAILGMGSFATGKLASSLGKKYPKLPVIGENGKAYEKQMQRIDELKGKRNAVEKYIEEFPSERLIDDEMASDAIALSEELGREIPMSDLWKHQKYSVTLQPDERMQSLFPQNNGAKTFRGTFGDFVSNADNLSSKADKKIASDIDEFKDKVNRWINKQEGAAEKASEFSDAQKAREAEVAAANKEILRLKPSLIGSKGNLSRAEKKLAEHNAEIEAVDKRRQGYLDGLFAADKEYQSARSDYRRINEPYLSLKKERARQNALLKAAKSESEKKKLSDEVSKLSKQIDDIIPARVEADKRMQPLHENVRNLRQMKDDASREIEALKTKNKAYNESVKKAKDWKNSLENKTAEQEAIINDKRKNSIAFGDSIAKYAGKADSLANLIDKGKKEIADLEAKRAQVAEEYRILTEEKGPELYRNAANSRYSATANEEIQRKRNELAKIDAKLDELNATLPEKPSRIGTLIGYGLVVPRKVGNSVRNSFVDNLAQSKFRGEYNVDFLKPPIMNAAETKLNAYSEMVDSPTSYKSRARRYILGSDR